MKKWLILSLITIILSVFVLSSCFTPAPKPAASLGTSIYNVISSWSTDTMVNVKGMVIGYPKRTINFKDVGGFSGVLFIEDEKSGIAVNNIGLNETYASTPDSYNFNIGDVVSVTGTLVKIKYDNYKITIKSTSSVSKSGTFDVKPDDLTTASATFTGEKLRLAKISGIATDVSNEHFEVITTNLGTVTVVDITSGQILDFDTIINNGNNVDVTGIV